MVDRSVAWFAVGAAVCAAAVAWAYAEGRRQALQDQNNRAEKRGAAASGAAAAATATGHDADAPTQAPAAATAPEAAEPPAASASAAELPAAAAAVEPPAAEPLAAAAEPPRAAPAETPAAAAAEPAPEAAPAPAAAPPPPTAPAKLEAMYAQMAADFAARGLDADAVRTLQQWFDHATDGGLPWPKSYARFDPPLPPRAVRLVALPLADASPAVCALGARATAAFARLLPPGVKCFANGRASYHATLLQLSHFLDPRPDPLRADGGCGSGGGSGGDGSGGLQQQQQLRPAAERPGPTPAALERELSTLARVFAAAAPFELRLERVVFARSGTLLFLWRDEPAGAAAALRAALRAAFPGASERQPVTVHSTLMRVVTAEPLASDVVAALAAEAEAWTEKARGTAVPARVVWRVIEEEFSTIAGERDVFGLGG